MFHEMKHYIGKYDDTSGQSIFRLILYENNPHWLMVTMARCAWDFLKHFSVTPRRNNCCETKGGDHVTERN